MPQHRPHRHAADGAHVPLTRVCKRCCYYYHYFQQLIANIGLLLLLLLLLQGV
jgi:hypothetical protein